ncbi:hypothetical protein QBC42DRAFT_319031 [Cladorrhinum samala]|uniref:Rhodopsin domain-containing protein n=1 Tax=Cladorrhinum samala TaxID=585594 RepID=A0AAV9I1K3_9PEZI|nr:hypothetical protein QBC42DRAFT_319031 [Cladorrhinum samala]
MARSSPQRAQESMIKPLVASSTNVGLGTHIETLSIDKKRTFLKFVFVSSLGYHVDLMLLKATFLLQYRRAFPLPAFQRICDVLLAFFAVWALAGLIGGATICLPLEQNWDPISPVWACKKRLWFWVGHGIVHVVTDVVILIMPLPLLKTLPLPRLHKVVLIGIFCLGFCTCVISAIRLTTLRPSFEDPDVTWTSATTVFFSVGEVACSIVCLCIPTLRPLVGRCSCCDRLGGSRNIMGLHPEEFRLSVPSTAGTIRPPSSLVPLTGVSTSSNR